MSNLLTLNNMRALIDTLESTPDNTRFHRQALALLRREAERLVIPTGPTIEWWAPTADSRPLQAAGATQAQQAACSATIRNVRQVGDRTVHTVQR